MDSRSTFIRAPANGCFMKIYRYGFLFLFLLLAVSWFSGSAVWKKTRALHFSGSHTGGAGYSFPEAKIRAKAAAARKFVLQKGFNTSQCFLIDMSLPSGQKRFFIYDLRKDSIRNSALVAHGNCFEYWLEGRRYSNVVGSGCTSLGKYRIGAPYTGKWGYSYKLHGLDTSNNKAFERTVVLHGHSCIPDAEIPDDICQSNGCPTVSPAFLLELKTLINNSPKPVLLWIYE